MQALPGPGEELEGSPPGLGLGRKELGRSGPTGLLNQGRGRRPRLRRGPGGACGLRRSAAEGSVGLGAGGLPAPAARPPPEKPACRRLPDASAEPVTLATPGLGTKLPGRRAPAACQRVGPLLRTPGPASVPPSPQETRPCFPFFSEAGVLGTYTLLGLLFLPALSLPVSMATPPNSRFQAAMTSPSPFLPPRPRGSAAGPGLQGCADPAQASPAPPKLWPQVCRPQVGPRPSEGPACPLRDPLHAGHPAGAATGWGGRGNCPSGLGSLSGPRMRNW